jgi:hypothetical protein
MTSKAFVVGLMSQYGDWPGPGMKGTVAEEFRSRDAGFLEDLYRYVQVTYEPQRAGPPVLAELLRMAREMPTRSYERLPEPALTEAERTENLRRLREIQQKLGERRRMPA